MNPKRVMIGTLVTMKFRKLLVAISVWCNLNLTSKTSTLLISMQGAASCYSSSFYPSLFLGKKTEARNLNDRSFGRIQNVSPYIRGNRKPVVLIPKHSLTSSSFCPRGRLDWRSYVIWGTLN